MSRVTEMAEAEADQVEAELGPDEELEPDGEEEAEEEEVVERESEEDMQARLKKISSQMDGEDKRHEKRYREILGDDFGMYAPCPLCQLAGYAFTWPPGTMGEEQRAAVAIVLGESGATEYQPAPWAEKCTACDGLGEVLSGALTQHGRLITCRACESRGWVEKREPVVPLVSVPQLGAPQTPQPVYPISNDGPDRWDRPPGHPHYGIEPKYVVGGG